MYQQFINKHQLFIYQEALDQARFQLPYGDGNNDSYILANGQFEPYLVGLPFIQTFLTEVVSPKKTPFKLFPIFDHIINFLIRSFDSSFFPQGKIQNIFQCLNFLLSCVEKSFFFLIEENCLFYCWQNVLKTFSRRTVKNRQLLFR